MTSKVAVVTGAAGGLGKQISRRLYERGYHVHLTDLDQKDAKTAALELDEHRTGAGSLDVRSEAACRDLAADLIQQHGRLDVWVNNAGVLATAPAWEQPEALRRNQFDVNTIGTINGTLAALEHMRTQRQGHILNIVSLAGIVPAPGESVYSASKHAVLAFSIATQADLRAVGERGVHISCLCPDGIWTPMLHDEVTNYWAAASFVGTLLTAEQVAERAMRLLDKPRPVATLPAWRGAALRIAALSPRLLITAAPGVFRLGQRFQRAVAKDPSRNMSRLE